MPVSAAKVGEKAPDFSVTDSNGKAHKLSDFKGKWVVLEWHNQGCPYVKKHYGSGNMQKLQKEWTAKGVVWLSVISSAQGQQGYVTAAQANAYVAEQKAAATAVLLDPMGTMGQAYGAKTTPHMFVISPEGTLVYNGAIDDRPTTDLNDVPTANNFVSAALNQAMAGKAVTTATTKPYGCGVKYATGS
jgi:peroxiredoxin